MSVTRLAVVQSAPAFLNRTSSIELASKKIAESASIGANLIVFTEAFIPGYPTWIWRLRPGGDWGKSEELHRRLLTNAVQVGSNQLDPLFAAAKKHRVTVVCGIEERDSDLSQATLYNSVITIGPEGTLLNHHRKLMPTNPERMVWGFGDASGLRVVNTPAGRIGALLCWENFMPLARYTLYAEGVEIYIAPTYDSGDDWIGSLRHIAREGRCWVVGCGNLMHASDFPDDMPQKESLYPDPDEWVNSGDSLVIAPDGKIVAGPLHREAGILSCELDLETAAAAKRALDIVGHYARPDIFNLEVHRQPQTPVSFSD